MSEAASFTATGEEVPLVSGRDEQEEEEVEESSRGLAGEIAAALRLRKARKTSKEKKGSLKRTKWSFKKKKSESERSSGSDSVFSPSQSESVSTPSQRLSLEESGGMEGR